MNTRRGGGQGGGGDAPFQPCSTSKQQEGKGGREKQPPEGFKKQCTFLLNFLLRSAIFCAGKGVAHSDEGTEARAPEMAPRAENPTRS